VDKLRELISMGALAQVNSLSFYGVFGRNAKIAAEKIVKKGLAQMIATDSHTARARSPRFQKLYKSFSPKLIDIMMRQNPEKIMAGLDIEVSSEGYKKAAKMSMFQKISFFFSHN
jgi:protein-tyrosine phosphatase